MKDLSENILVRAYYPIIGEPVPSIDISITNDGFLEIDYSGAVERFQLDKSITSDIRKFVNHVKDVLNGNADPDPRYQNE